MEGARQEDKDRRSHRGLLEPSAAALEMAYNALSSSAQSEEDGSKRGHITVSRSEQLNRTFASEQSKMASPLPVSPLWASRNLPTSPLNSAQEQRYREDAIRLLAGVPETECADATIIPSFLGSGSPLRSAFAEIKREEGTSTHRERGDHLELRLAVDDACAKTRKRVAGGYRQPTTAGTLRKPNSEAPAITKKMTAESKVIVLENQIQDLQALLKKGRKNEADARKTEASAIADLEALRAQMEDALQDRDSKLESAQKEFEALLQTHNALKASLQKKKSQGKNASNDVVIDKQELAALQEKLRSTNTIIAALSAKVEQQRGQMADLESRCSAAENEAKGLNEELGRLHGLHEDIKTNSEAQSTQNRKQLTVAKDQIALMIATNAVHEKATKEKQEKLQKQLKDNQKDIRELNKALQKKDTELDDLKNEMLKKLWRPDSINAGSQTEEVPNRWLWLLTLKIAVMSDRDLQHSKECQTDTVRIDGVVTGKARTVSKGTMTSVEQKKAKMTDEECWWADLMVRIESLAKYLSNNTHSVKGEEMMNEGHILSLISTIYAEKSIADFIDMKNERPLQPFREFVWGYLLRECGDKIKAEKLLVRFLANVISRTASLKLMRARNPLEADIYLRFRHRYGLFIRFLGFPFVDSDGIERYPIPTDGLNVYLQGLVRARSGACPLLEASRSQMLVPSAQILSAIDYVFAGSKSFDKERIKTDILDKFVGMSGENDDLTEIDLEKCMEVVIHEYEDISKRWDSRLEALFAANDQDGDGNLDFAEFQQMVLKMGETDENVTKNAPMYSQMYATMCTYPRVDASIFCKVAKKYRVGMFVPGASYQPSPEKSVENVMSCQRLVPLYKAASDSMLLNLEAIQSHPHGMEMLYKWTLCEKLMRQREEAEMAWIVFNQAARAYSSIQVHLKEAEKKLLQTQDDDDDEENLDAEGNALSPAEKRRRMLASTAFSKSETAMVTSEKSVMKAKFSQSFSVRRSNAKQRSRNETNSAVAQLNPLPALKESQEAAGSPDAQNGPLQPENSGESGKGRQKSLSPMGRISQASRMAVGKSDSKSESPVRDRRLNGDKMTGSASQWALGKLSPALPLASEGSATQDAEFVRPSSLNRPLSPVRPPARTNPSSPPADDSADSDRQQLEQLNSRLRGMTRDTSPMASSGPASRRSPVDIRDKEAKGSRSTSPVTDRTTRRFSRTPSDKLMSSFDAPDPGLPSIAN